MERVNILPIPVYFPLQSTTTSPIKPSHASTVNDQMTFAIPAASGVRLPEYGSPDNSADGGWVQHILVRALH